LFGGSSRLFSLVMKLDHAGFIRSPFLFLEYLPLPALLVQVIANCCQIPEFLQLASIL